MKLRKIYGGEKKKKGVFKGMAEQMIEKTKGI